MHHNLCSVQDGKKQELAEMTDHAIMGKKLLRTRKCEYLCRS